jgi:hypothetical protein
MQAFTVSAAARLCGVDRRTLQRAIQAGRLPLDSQHCLSREALIAAGYLDAVSPQVTSPDMPHDTPHGTPQNTSLDMPHGTPQELVQATALLAFLERLTTAITDLHEEVRSLRDDLRHLSRRTPQAPVHCAAVYVTGYAAVNATGTAARNAAVNAARGATGTAAALAADPRPLRSTGRGDPDPGLTQAGPELHADCCPAHPGRHPHALWEAVGA